MKTFDPRDVTAIANGDFITGFAEGTVINCEKDNENYQPHVGAMGDTSRSRNAGQMGTITFTLKGTSPSNSLLNSLSKSKDTFPVQVADNNDPNKIVSGNYGWIEKPAALNFGEEEEDVEWTVKVADYEQDITD